MVSLEDLPFEDLYIRERPDFPAICNLRPGTWTGPAPTHFVPEMFQGRAGVLREILLEFPIDKVDFAVNFDNFRLRVAQTITHDGSRAFGMRRISKVVPTREIITDDPAIMEEIDSWDDRKGLVLIVGPTGSGKTTTAIGYTNTRSQRHGGVTVTAEDPIEYILQEYGVAENGAVFTNIQWPVENVGEWAPKMANAMRYKPDVILIGEARTPEAVMQLLQISISGHTVVCTTHGDSPILGIQRLMDIGRSSALGESINSAMADALVAVLHQRRDAGKTEFELLTTNRHHGVVDQVKTIIRGGVLPQLANQIEQQKNRRRIAFKR